MAISITITPPVLEEGVTHTSTTIDIYDSSELDNKIYTDTLTDDLYHLVVDRELVPNTDYYLVARFIYEPGGMQKPTKPIKFTPVNIDDDFVFNFKPKDIKVLPYRRLTRILPPGGFTLKLFDLADINENIKSVTSIITDLNGNVYFESIDKQYDMEYVNVTVMLPINEVFLLRTSLKLESGSSSLLSTCVFRVGGYQIGDFKVINTSSEYTKTSLPIITTSTLLGFVRNHVKVYDYLKEEPIAEFTSLEEVNISNINSKRAITEITAEMDNGDMIGPIFVYSNIFPKESFPYSLPYVLG